MTTWRDRQNCRTCKHADTEEHYRRYTRKNEGVRCLWPVERLEMPKMPSCVSFTVIRNAVVQKRYVYLNDPDCGAKCPVWQRWEGEKK